ncbi:hypothetical protein SKAU_G00236120 [Synaphobranchus kaupii]|uniref:C2H2-type domain-containing protein n=1 Tax=Synaphobranchus kaupii TaxID=118154 RepID=A0A9Q1ITV3_SYNKA|nr:hypothetical protein SKAU_G00236120 [Synaphobranchus kaupii]
MQDYAEKERTMAKALEDLKANFYCELCDKQYYKHQEFDNHINSYDHAHTQRLKELKQREFARNVSSKSRKDERKQERALRRLHELAEQRREVQCAPGSGPKFRSTTVAVEGGSREACSEENIVGSQPATALDTGAQNDASNTSSSKQVQWPYTGKAKKQMYRQKIAFSFSLPKKTSIRLESSAAVFCENTEEGLAERTSRQRLRAAAADLNLLSPPTGEKALNYRETIYGAVTQEDLVRQENGSTQIHATSEVSANHASPEVTSDLCALLVYSADVTSPCISPSTFPFHLNNAGILLHMEDSQESLNRETTEKKCETIQEVGSEPKAFKGAVEQSHPLFSDSLLSNEATAATAPCVGNEVGMGSRAAFPFAKPSQPFCSVLSKDASTVLQWPSEMLSFTRAAPSLSFSCNPLHFDFRASRSQTEQGTGGARVSEANDVTLSQKPHDDAASNSPETPLHFDKHIEEPAHVSDSNPARRGSHLPGCSGHQDMSAPMGGKDDHYENDRAGCLRQLKRYRKQKQKSFRKPSKEWTHSCKRATDKSWDRNSRQEYRSHKRRRRRRDMCRGAGRYDSDAEKSTNFHKQPECWAGFDSQFCSNTSQQVQPLDESKQSPQNQEETSSDASKVDTTGSGRWKAAGGINGTAGRKPPSSDNHSNSGLLQGHGKINLRDASQKQADVIESCPHRLLFPQMEKSSTMESQSLCCGHSSHQNCSLKRKRGSLSDEEEEGCQPPIAFRSSAGRSGGLELFSKVGVSEGDSRICCRLERIRKRQRSSLANPSPVTDRGAADDERGMLTVAAENISVCSAIQHPVLQKALTNVLEKEMNERSKSPDKVLEKCIEWTGGPSSAQNRAGYPRPSVNESTLIRNLNPIENMSIRNDIRSANRFHNIESNVETSNTQDYDEHSVKANSCQQEVRVAMQQISESTSNDKSFQHNSRSQPSKRHLGLAYQEVKPSHEGLRFENVGGAFHSTQQGFQHPSDKMEKHCLLQAQVHRRALRPHTRFHGKLKPVLSGPPIQVPSQILHPVHLPPPMSSTSITIRHTILQHHATLLQPQPTLFSQVFPITPPPLAAEMCPPGPPAFMAPPELSVVAPTGLHPVAMTFHALPRPGVFPTMLPPHPALFPLQPLF